MVLHTLPDLEEEEVAVFFAKKEERTGRIGMCFVLYCDLLLIFPLSGLLLE